MTITEPRTARASSVAGVLRPEVWSAVRDLEDRDEVREVLGYFLEEAAHEAQTVQAARSLLRALDLLATDLLYLERVVESLRRRFEVVEAEPAAAPGRRSSSAGNVVRVDFGGRRSA